MSQPTASFHLHGISVEVFADPVALGAAAAAKTAALIREAIARRGKARILVGTGNSQLRFIEALIREPGIAWSQVETFHLDEYVGISAEHPASFRLWIRTRFVEQVRPGASHYLQGDAPDLDAQLSAYAAALAAEPIDIAFVGIGENGHIAFNDPHVADFNDPLIVKRVALDQACQQQQVGEGHFPDLASVPREALTITCTGLMRAEHWICCVPDLRKAKAVKAALEGPLTTECPASLTRKHPSAFLYLDTASASLLDPRTGQ